MSTILNLIKINTGSEVTIAEQLVQQFTWLIASGHLKPGDSLPSLRQMADHLGINLHTVRSAYRKMESAGLVATQQGSESVVLPVNAGQIASLGSSLRTHTIGVLLPSLDNPFYHAFLQGIEDRVNAERTMLFVCNANEDVDGARRYFVQLVAKQVDGIIVASLGEAIPLKPGTNPSMPPVVSADWPDYDGYSVLIDLESASHQAVRHLLEHGHRRIGLITFREDVSNVRQLNTGYAAALQERGIALDSSLIAAMDGFLIADGIEAARRLFSLGSPPTAIFAIADMLALGAISLLKKEGLRIPQDVAVIGFNDIPLATLIEPPLTTVHAPSREMGWDAMDMLQNLIDGKKPHGRQKILPVSLVIRGSCGFHG